jgi:hypothetical protein
MYVGSSEGSIYKLDNSAILDEETVIAPVAIESFGQTAFMGVEEISVLKFGGYRIIGRGSGNLDVTAYTLDRVQTVPCASITMSNTPGLSVTKQCNIVNERVSFKFGIDAANEHFTINAINIYYKVKAIMRPM